MARKSKTKAKSTENKAKRVRLSQSDVPGFTLEETIRVAQALAEQHGCKPTRPLLVAQAMGMKPTSGNFRGLCGASIAYGLTDGGYNADTIQLTELGRRVVRPTTEGDDVAALREAVVRPRAIKEFLQRYDGQRMPRKEIGRNVLNAEIGIPDEVADRAFDIIVETSRQVGVLTEIKGDSYVNLRPSDDVNTHQILRDDEISDDDPLELKLTPDSESSGSAEGKKPEASADSSNARLRRVFVTHGKNKSFLDPIKKLLAFGEFEPVISVEKETASQPLPEKWASDMRSCGAAIIHVEDERRLMDSEANEHVVLNQNVLIEIGAAMALYGQRFILLVKNGLDLPSNLQGLFQVRYEGDSLDGNATLRLMEAIRDMKSRPLPPK